MKKILTILKSNAELTEKEIEKIISSVAEKTEKGFEVLPDSMLYSANGGGKRIRPTLTIEFCKLFAGDVKAALPLAAAVELVHTYSLIHDDLPCMDNDDMRRGKPTNHKVFGEATALLAGDGLLTLAFSVICSSEELSSEAKVKAVKMLADFAGANGMIGGQLLDLEAEITPPSEERLLKIYELKTGALLRAAAKLGCLAAKITDDAVLEKADCYAKNIGIAFQIIDDILDVCGDEKTLGKPIGSDEKNGKKTFVSFHGIDESKKIASEMTKEAISAISDFTNNEKLVELAEMLLNRQA